MNDLVFPRYGIVSTLLRGLVLSLGVGVFACGGDEVSIKDTSVDSPAPVTQTIPDEVPESSSPPPPPPAPPPDFELERRFSPPTYASAASRIIPFDDLAFEAVGAARRTELQAVELDFFENDWLYRKGALVLLGTERGRIVALTTRFYADIRYPSPKLIPDGWGRAEIGRQYLAVGSPDTACFHGRDCTTRRFRLQRKGRRSRERPTSVSDPVVEYRVFDDHDVALLYFSQRDAPFRARDTLGIQNPTRTIKRKLQDASNLYGFEMSLVSKESLAVLRSKINVESAAGSLLKLGVSLLASPVIGAIAGSLGDLSAELQQKATAKITDLVSEHGAALLSPYVVPFVDSLEGREARSEAERLRPPDVSSMPSLQENAKVEITGNGVDIVGELGNEPGVRLLGVQFETEAQPVLGQYLNRALTAGTVIISSDTWGSTNAGALVLLPGDNLVLNVELLRHGFARLDLEHPDLLRSFPWLVDAAWDALQSRTGLARDWAEDDAYVSAVEGLR